VQHYENARAFSAVVQRLLDECEKDLILSNSEPEQQRVIKRFALVLVAGRLACEFSVVPFNRKEIESAVLAVIKSWLADGANLPDRIRGAQAVQAFIQRHRSRLRKWDSEDEQVRDLAGYIKDELFLFTAEGFREAANGHDPEEVAQELYRCRLLMRDGRNMKPKYSIMLGGAFNRIRLYAVKNTILEHDFAGHAPVSEDLLVEQTA